MNLKQLFFSILLIFSLTSYCQKRQITLLTDSIVIGDNFTTRQIKFNLGKSTLSSDSSATLDSVVTFMNKYKNIIIEIGVYSDTKTSDLCCSNPTQEKSENILKYLTQHGISNSRLIAKGYGETKLLISDTTIAQAKTMEEKESMHYYNRRVVFEIIGFIK